MDRGRGDGRFAWGDVGRGAGLSHRNRDGGGGGGQFTDFLAGGERVDGTGVAHIL